METSLIADSNGSRDELNDSCAEISKPEPEESISVSEEEAKQPESINGHENDTGEKRQRKRVQRLSETWNRAHEAKQEEKVKAVQAVSAAFEGATGTALGEIPLIEATIRKVKPADLKLLHLIIYNRPGSVGEIRSNLRKFRGFGFELGSEQYEKKSTYIQQRSTCDLRETLRILNLEVTGTREQLASRLLEFLHKPTASSVKYKGKIVKRHGRKNKSKGDNVSKKPKSRPVKKNVTTSEPSIDDSSQQDIDEPDLSSESENSESDVSSVADSVKIKTSKKRAKMQQQSKPAKPNLKRVKKGELSDTEEDENGHKSIPAKVQKVKSTKKEFDSDEDVPLSNLTSTKVIPPTDSELKKNIIDLLKTVNLEETSLKVVREKIFANYPNIDLSDRKDFINSTVKEFLAQS
uniref:Protein DEK n=1 Tax=Schistosoma japonicum TaxID=6182 RepID=C1LEK3_SCHJA|nr:Protein DEK [Schistosoma japonicum]